MDIDTKRTQETYDSWPCDDHYTYEDDCYLCRQLAAFRQPMREALKACVEALTNVAVSKGCSQELTVGERNKVDAAIAKAREVLK